MTNITRTIRKNCCLCDGGAARCSHVGCSRATTPPTAGCARSAQSYPVKTVRIIVPVAPGGGTDPQARLLGRKFQESMGQTFVIENRTGAASMIGTEFVVRVACPTATRCCARRPRSPAPTRCARICRSTC